jgi:hypothetical protein
MCLYFLALLWRERIEVRVVIARRTRTLTPALSRKRAREF